MIIIFKPKIYAIVDTETLGGAAQDYCPTYQCAGIACTRKNELSNINIVVLNNLFLDNAFYGKFKKDYYRELLHDPATVICYNEQEAEKAFSKWLNENNVTCVCAHNSAFDFKKTFVSKCVEGIEFIDIWQAFFDTIGNYSKYNKFCCKNGLFTCADNLKMSAEVCYKFVSGNLDFQEEHTALSDCKIELEILKAIWNTHRKFERNVHKGDAPYRFKVVKCKFKGGEKNG